MKFISPKRIIAEDFPEDQREVVSKLGFIINNVLEQLAQILNKKLNVTDNLNESITTIKVKVDTNGIPLVTTQIKFTLTGKYNGVSVLNVSNLDSPSSTPTAAPFIILEDLSTGLLQVKRTYGLQANTNYNLTLRIIGGN